MNLAINQKTFLFCTFQKKKELRRSGDGKQTILWPGFIITMILGKRF